ncbi:hypothetical protein D910_08216 [Dendroctonus ponderosae]|uniref:Uncharacterized protein n=1 Tax=Dendroctonus ponderosae TaxID=77166 RepID=U4UL45_DENPD|nr:hypothetical protein D910_08216 [Dendroctonus ponderosae]
MAFELTVCLRLVEPGHARNSNTHMVVLACGQLSDGFFRCFTRRLCLVPSANCRLFLLVGNMTAVLQPFELKSDVLCFALGRLAWPHQIAGQNIRRSAEFSIVLHTTGRAQLYVSQNNYTERSKGLFFTDSVQCLSKAYFSIGARCRRVHYRSLLKLSDVAEDNQSDVPSVPQKFLRRFGVRKQWHMIGTAF